MYGRPGYYYMVGLFCRIVDGKQFPYDLWLYFGAKVILLLLALWLVLKKRKNSILNLLLLNLAVFDLGGGCVVLANKALQRHTIPDVFFSDRPIYFLSGKLIPNAYFLLPLILGMAGVGAVLLYFKRFHFSASNKIKYTCALAAGIVVPVLLLKLFVLLF